MVMQGQQQDCPKLTLHIAMFCVTTCSSLVSGYQRFVGAYRLHLQVQRWTHNILLKRWHSFTRMQRGITSHKIFIYRNEHYKERSHFPILCEVLYQHMEFA
jgi:hypothetical protein